VYAILALILVFITAVRLVPTYTIFTGTYDEPYHIASGMEWLDQGKRRPLEQPPLAQAAVALGLYLKGFRYPEFDRVVYFSPGHNGNLNPFDRGLAIPNSGGDYWNNLRLARLGVLPFLILACAVIWLWARRWFSRAVGLWAVLLFVSLPAILGHAAVATTDMACAATVALALYQLMRWLEIPGLRSCIRFGVALSLAFLCKFSSLEFIAVCCIAAMVYFVLVKRGSFPIGRHLRGRIGQACITVCVTLVLLWAGYRFSVKPISQQVGYHPSVDQRFGASPVIRNAAYRVLERPLPLVDVGWGIFEVFEHNRQGHPSYLLGQYGRMGWWYFFPVVLGVKTPIGFLLLAMGGLLAVLWRWKSGSWQQFLTALFPIAILLACMTSHINLGVRHILSIYPLLALMAGHAISLTFRHRTWRILSVISVLAASTVVLDAWRAHPDYLAYFNQVAGNHPEKILCGSDLDWGQDLHRLSLRLKSLGVKEVAIRYFGSALLPSADLPHYHVPSSDEKVTGYYAISVYFKTMDYASEGAHGWLRQHTPLERIGRSIDLYYTDQ